MHLFRQASTLALAITCAYSVVKAEEVPPSGSPYSLATDIADCYTRSFPSEGSSTEMPLKNQKAHETRPAHLGAKAKREVAFNRIFAKSHHYALQQQQMAPILNEYAWADLNLFYGTPATPAYHLMSRINSATTLLGEGVLATMLVTPTSNIAELKHRQSLIKAFLDSPEEVAQLKRSLQAYQKADMQKADMQKADMQKADMYAILRSKKDSDEKDAWAKVIPHYEGLPRTFKIPYDSRLPCRQI